MCNINFREIAKYINTLNSQDITQPAWIIDVSGGISETQWELIVELIRGAKLPQGDVILWDTRLQAMVPTVAFLSNPAMFRQGHGGTDLVPAVDWANNYSRNRLDGIVVFTDGEFGYPDVRDSWKIPVVWVFIDSRVSLDPCTGTTVRLRSVQ